MSSDSQQPMPPKSGFSVQKNEIGPDGVQKSTWIYDPHGSRHDHQGENQSIDRMEDIFGWARSKSITLGHIPKSKESNMILALRASASLQNMSEKVPGLQAFSDLFTEAYVLGPAKIYMGVEGAAVNSDNTNTNRNVNSEEKKKGIFRLR